MQNPPQTKSINFQKSKTKSRISKRQRNRRRNKQKLLNFNQNKAFSSIRQSGRRNGADIWREAYENAIRWQTEHQGNYWRRAAKNLQRENEMLRQQLQQHVMKPTPDVYYETSEDDEEKEAKFAVKKEKPEELGDDEVDVKYLEFLQITFKHREELRLKRLAEAEGQSQEIAESLVEVEATVKVEMPSQAVAPASD